MAAALSSILRLLFAVGLRVRYFSGLGLGDDYLLRNDIIAIVRDGHVNFDANGYRLGWWIPTALSCRLLGVTEGGLIAPILVFDALGMVLVCLYPTLTHGLLVLLLGFSLWQSVATARITHVAFGDLRSATRFLATLPARPAYSDFQLGSWFTFSGLFETGRKFNVVEPNDLAKRRQQLAAVTSGYLVTGGGREPYYGCTRCIPSADDVTNDRWILLKEFPSPIAPTSWRTEPLRIWEANASP